MLAAYDNDELAEHRLENFETLAVVHLEPYVWMSKPGFELEPGMTLFSSAITVIRQVSDTLLPAKALGIDLRIVAGYNGSAERSQAVLRGEADMTTAGYSVAKRYSKNGDFETFLTITNGPFEMTPNVPYLAGVGGLVDRFSRDLSEDERADRMQQAHWVAASTFAARGIFVTAKAPEALKSCLKSEVSEVILGEEFQTIVNGMGHPASALGADDAHELLVNALDARLSIQDLLAELTTTHN